MELKILIYSSTNRKCRFNNRMYSKQKSIFIVCNLLLSLLTVISIIRNRTKSFHLILYKIKSFSHRTILKIKLKIFLIYCISAFTKLKVKTKFIKKSLKFKNNKYKHYLLNKNKYFKM